MGRLQGSSSSLAPRGRDHAADRGPDRQRSVHRRSEQCGQRDQCRSAGRIQHLHGRLRRRVAHRATGRAADLPERRHQLGHVEPRSTLSPAFTGTPTAPTPAANDNSTKLATTAYADRAANNAATAAPYVVAESLGANGYRKWSTGFTEQWGITSSTSADFTLTFPTAFANNCWGVTTNPNNGGAGGSAAYVTSADTFTKTTAILRGRTVTNGGSVAAQPNLSIVWRAWGN